VAHRWKTHTPGYDPVYYPDIQILSKRFNVPQLRRRRRISVLLPWDYHQSGRRYPVLYLQDGQNLFEDDAPYGTWGVDKQLARLAGKGRGNFILVAIDHGGDERIREFMPYEHQKWGEGLGMDYARFLAETLKPIYQHALSHITRQTRRYWRQQHGWSDQYLRRTAFSGDLSRFMIFSPSLWAAPQTVS
jgi:enterochelin esterase-like enzyme